MPRPQTGVPFIKLERLCSLGLLALSTSAAVSCHAFKLVEGPVESLKRIEMVGVPGIGCWRGDGVEVAGVGGMEPKWCVLRVTIRPGKLAQSN